MLTLVFGLNVLLVVLVSRVGVLVRIDLHLELVGLVVYDVGLLGSLFFIAIVRMI